MPRKTITSTVDALSERVDDVETALDLLRIEVDLAGQQDAATTDDLAAVEADIDARLDAIERTLDGQLALRLDRLERELAALRMTAPEGVGA